MSNYYDRQGRPIGMEDWMAEFSKDRRVDLTDLGTLGRVSTVFLGLNHNWGEGPPLLFETMIFGGPMDEFQDRYTTEEQAVAGHAFAVQALMFYQPEKRPSVIHNGRKPRKKE